MPREGIKGDQDYSLHMNMDNGKTSMLIKYWEISSIDAGDILRAQLLFNICS